MSKIKMKLKAEEVMPFAAYLDEVLQHVGPEPSIALRIIMLNVSRVAEKIHAKRFLNVAVSLKLPEEQALALQWVMAVYAVPTHWLYTANVIRLVQHQLPQITTDKIYEMPVQLPEAQKLLTDGQ